MTETIFEKNVFHVNFDSIFFSPVDNKELNPSHDVEASQPITAERRRELEHYLKLKRFFCLYLNWGLGTSDSSSPEVSWVFLYVSSFVSFPVTGGNRTGAAGGLKTRTWSLTQTRRSLRPSSTQTTENCGRTQMNLWDAVGRPEWNNWASTCSWDVRLQPLIESHDFLLAPQRLSHLGSHSPAVTENFSFPSDATRDSFIVPKTNQII